MSSCISRSSRWLSRRGDCCAINAPMNAFETGSDYISLAWNDSLSTESMHIHSYLVYRQLRADDSMGVARMIHLPMQHRWQRYTVTRLRDAANYTICLTYLYGHN